MTEDEHRITWKHIIRRLTKANLTGVWVRELNKEDRIHYHLLFTTEEVNVNTIKAAVPEAMKSVSRVHCERVYNQLQACYYFTKAKIKGEHPKSGKWCNDRWRDKRRLFYQNIKLDKTGSFGQFWNTPKETIWQGIIQEQKTIARYKHDNDYDFARQLYILIDKAIPQKTIEINLAKQRMKCGENISP
jgi:hypothetical protein